MIRSLISGEHALNIWLAAFFVSGLVAGVATGFFKARKIQPNGFKWKVFRDESLFAVLNLAITTVTLGALNGWLRSHGYISFNHGPAPWWQIGLEYIAYFFLFDTWFYWLHRGMHEEPFYTWIHKLHHRSTSPNVLTTLSVSPFESLINGGFVPLFLTLFTVNDATMALIGPTNIIMGLYVHMGYEFLPRWWNRSWATKWFITTTFHDQHHRHFIGNFGGYTTIWDYLCGTVRKNYESGFDAVKGRADGGASQEAEHAVLN